jgi:hypothetical protein
MGSSLSSLFGKTKVDCLVEEHEYDILDVEEDKHVVLSYHEVLTFVRADF